MKKIQITSKLCGISIGAFFLFSTILASCSKSDDSNGGGGSGTANTTFKVTDAPIDDASVTAAFVTISDIKLNGVSVSGFTKTTVNLLALQNGSTQSIGNFNLSTGTYSNVTFVLDFDTDASGNTPGSYVMTSGSVKHKLQSSTNVITATKTIALIGSGTNEIVADFDLRKMIIHTAGADHYDLATSAELNNDVRLTVENNTISGTVTDNTVGGAGKIIVYAYKKGTFNRATELSAQGASGVQFANAVTSATVTAGGNYQLHFLDSGAYELYFASYKDTNADGEYELQGTLVATVGGGLDLLNLNLSANATLTANVTATAVLP